MGYALIILPSTVAVIFYYQRICTNSMSIRSAFKNLLGKRTGKRPLGRPRRGWVDNIRMDLKEIAINSMNWFDWTQDSDYWRILVNAVLNLRVS